ncbi:MULTISPECIES: chromosomal replication initiator protein DnaA [unclassified Aeromicrobium]|uniref:chromosomal replication initiator protein DnaA n=1 Tax=unclassified Aeromicrobium TaxID=2633570 RepID=UPI0006F2216D|nr:MULTISPECIES: chromosomal replication initiator protein DnaA [unclassified Aeromicrobium]KQX74146.1 chromosomal replication initiation protein [Aeromicrobium sp. Root472D3]MBD8608379.1 chromosomal replication initiator protein DnaA [Aeromicrobium sp. CFBP 8757]
MQDGQDASPDEHLNEVWQRAVATLSPGAKVWVYSAKPLTLHNNIMIVAVQDDLTRAQLESRVRPALEHAISTTLQQETRLVVTIDPSLIDSLHSQQDDLSINRQVGASTQEQEPDDEDDDSGDEFVPSWAERSSAPPRIGTVAEARLNPRYLFENFVIGSSNRFAHAAAVAVAEAPGKAYNPLVIHGESGLGKTHLLHAIGHYVLNLYPSSRVRYVNSEEFTNDVINAIRENRTAALKRKYREIDVLLVDDIQFLEGKESTQTEFFHTFNALHNENKQIVMTSDRPPKNLTTLEDRLRNRFEWGLTTDVQPPDLETRIAILRKKAANEKLTAPADVLEFIASKVQTNIRELEGALIRATAFANLNGTTVDLQLAQIVLKDLIAEGEEPDITAGMIMAQTAAYSEFSIDDLCSTNRSRNLVLARQIAMYLCRELTDMSLPKIGQEFGNRDHTTVMHADRKIRKLMAEKHAVYNQVTELTARIKQQARQS